MKNNIKNLVKCVAIPLIVGGLSALLTMGAMKNFSELNQPPLSPPAIVFPVVWTVLYVLMGIASYFIVESNDSRKNIALLLYGVQLIFNFFWSMIFFNLDWYGFSLIWLLIMIIIIIADIYFFNRISKNAAYLMLPYIVWCLFAAYLNFGIWRLN